MGRNRKPGFLIVLLGFLLILFSLAEKPIYAQSGKIPPGKGPEKGPTELSPGIGTEEVPREDGGKDRLYYSITTPEEEEAARRKEKEKEEKSWDILKNIIIDHRRR